MCRESGSGARLHPLADSHTVLSAHRLTCGQFAGQLLIQWRYFILIVQCELFYQCCVVPSQTLAKEHACANTAISPTKGVISAESALGFV